MPSKPNIGKQRTFDINSHPTDFFLEGVRIPPVSMPRVKARLVVGAGNERRKQYVEVGPDANARLHLLSKLRRMAAPPSAILESFDLVHLRPYKPTFSYSKILIEACRTGPSY
ncbi:hypothetical protein JDV02_009113 [Purpureocillium takamizusanense]|uniref:Uncharacterized protein n=1 Tax=Purpureocillium takamizusanense TaxID=2060973 RepID=A0A9Q8VFU8_9HYPO|nr:uncharacterized protein JDV02_009113 [Purpureocillium takamizusanense]UNI23284.1 hypothetical protein JDV02_009113 [Purpureocillium takamizusanense]